MCDSIHPKPELPFFLMFLAPNPNLEGPLSCLRPKISALAEGALSDGALSDRLTHKECGGKPGR